MSGLPSKAEQLRDTLTNIATLSATLGDHGDALRDAERTALHDLLASLITSAKDLRP